MEYNSKHQKYNAVNPGTAGVTQRISTYDVGGELDGEETSGLYALVKNDVMPCGQNQY